MGTKKLLRPPQAAKLLQDVTGLGSSRTLSKLRCIGGGPRFYKIGSRMIGYAEEDLLEWAKSRISEPLASTSDAEAA